MSDQERVLLLGITGVRKETALDQLEEYQENHYGNARFRSIHFEKSLDKSIFTYVKEAENQQRFTWDRAWRRMKRKHSEVFEEHNQGSEDIILCMHGVLTWGNYGARSPLVIRKVVEDFRPTIIITLIDDIYLLRHRIHETAEGEPWRGTPELEQLVQARRSSIFLGSLLAKQRRHDEDPPLPHYVLSIWHPARVLDRLILNHPDLKPVYMSFPITTPRTYRLASGSIDVKEELNSIFERTIDFGKTHRDLTFFSPLTIDEYPLVFARQQREDFPHLNSRRVEREPEGDNDNDECTYDVEFHMEDRWDVRDFYGDNETLLTKDGQIPDIISIPEDEVIAIEAMVESDVPHRDYQLVEQSRQLAVFNPVLQNRKGEREISGGVNNEIVYAQSLWYPVYIYQDPSRDPDDLVRKEYKKSSGSMEEQPGSELIKVEDNLDDFLQRLVS